MRVGLTMRLDGEVLDCLTSSFPEVEFRAAENVAQLVEGGFSPEVLFCWSVSSDDMDRMPDLRWIQVRSAGVNHLPLRSIAERGILLSNGRGVYSIPVAENLLAMMLAFAAGLPELLRAQERKERVKAAVGASRFELENQWLLVVGVGNIGSTLARKARGLGMRVMGCDFVRPVGNELLHRFVPPDELKAALPEADHVALCLPLTDATRGLFGEGMLARLKPTAFLYNGGRGAVVVTDALVRALQEGRLAGAGLDVTDPEPLPPDSPLWSMPNVLLTQHTGGSGPHNERRIVDLFSENLHRFMNGYPLLNVVDPLRGF